MIMNKIAGIILIALLALSSCNKTNKNVIIGNTCLYGATVQAAILGELDQ